MPFWAFDIDHGDVVECDDKLNVSSIIQKSGDVCFRFRTLPAIGDRLRGVLDKLEEAGVVVEFAVDDSMNGLAVAGDELANGIQQFLHELEQRSWIDYETVRRQIVYETPFNHAG